MLLPFVLSAVVVSVVDSVSPFSVVEASKRIKNYKTWSVCEKGMSVNFVNFVALNRSDHPVDTTFIVWSLLKSSKCECLRGFHTFFFQDQFQCFELFTLPHCLLLEAKTTDHFNYTIILTRAKNNTFSGNTSCDLTWNFSYGFLIEHNHDQLNLAGTRRFAEVTCDNQKAILLLQ